MPLALRDQPAWRAVLGLAWPVLLQQVLIFAVGLCDSLLMGRFRPEGGDHIAAQSAQTTATYLTWFISSYTYLVSVGGTALVARFTGAGDRAGAVHVANQSILLAAVLGLVGTAAGLLGAGELVRLLRLEGEAARYAVEYLTPIFALLVFQVVETAGVACLVGAGDTRTGLFVLGGVAVLNVPLSLAFLHWLGPVRGIALGTGVSHLIGGLAVLAVLAKGRAGLRLNLRQLRPDAKLIRRLLNISVPAGVDSLTVAAGQLWFLSIVNSLSDAASSAHGIALRWEAIAFLTGTAFGTAAMTLTGQNLGARRPDRAARTVWTAFKLGCVVMSLCGVVFFLFARPMFELFCPYPDQQPVVEAGVPVLRLVALAMPPLACTIIFTQALRGAGDTRVPVLFTLIGFFLVRIPLAYLLAGSGLGLFGAWLAMSIDVFLRGGLVLGRFAGGRWKRIEV